MAANPDRNREDVFKRANAFLADIPDTESDESVKRYLKEAGVDVFKIQDDARSLVAKMKGKRRLEQAKARREGKIQVWERIKSLASNFGAAAKQLQELAEAGDLHGAEMLARKFEASSPEDLASLQEDLALLKEIEKDNAPDAGK